MENAPTKLGQRGRLTQSVKRNAGASPKPARKRGTVNRDLIMNVASVMFRERGYDRTSLDDIAKALNITKPSLYYHFSSKEEILLAGIDAGYELFQQWLEERDQPKASGRQQLIVFISLYVALLKDNVLSLLVSDERVMSDIAKDRYRRYKRLLQQNLINRLDAGQQDGTLAVANSRHAAFAIFGMINWMVNWPSAEINRPTEDIAADFITLLSDGIFAK